MTAPQLQRSLFIASIGNLTAPYTLSRHSAGHTLLKAMEPVLLERIGFAHPFYQTWQCPSLMNVSGPALTRRLKAWLAEQRRRRLYRPSTTEQLSTVQHAADDAQSSSTSYTLPLSNSNSNSNPNRGEYDHQKKVEEVGSPSSLSRQFGATLAILHDELEAELGQLKVRRGGPEQASLRGHRGLISVMESLRGAGLLLRSSSSKQQQQQQRLQSAARSRSKSNSDDPSGHSHSDLEILRIGIGIGRPESRNRDDVSRYVLADMGPRELLAIRRAASPVVDVLVKELYGKKGRRKG
jgi:PTH1 family peptidyl-tRNA hydrolase